MKRNISSNRGGALFWLVLLILLGLFVGYAVLRFSGKWPPYALEPAEEPIQATSASGTVSGIRAEPADDNSPPAAKGPGKPARKKKVPAETSPGPTPEATVTLSSETTSAPEPPAGAPGEPSVEPAATPGTAAAAPQITPATRAADEPATTVLSSAPTPPPKPLSEVLQRAGTVPQSVKLTKPTNFEVKLDGKDAGTLLAPAGTSMGVIWADPVAKTVDVNFGGNRHTIAMDLTDFEEVARARFAQLPEVASTNQPFSARATPSPTPAQPSSLSAATAIVPAAFDLSRTLQVDVSAAKRTKDEGATQRDKTDTVSVRVKLANTDPQDELKDLYCSVYVFGENIAISDVYQVLLVDNFTATIGPRASFDHATKDVVMEYEESGRMLWGLRYTGYILVVKNEAGKIGLIKAFPKSFERIEKLAGLDVGATVDRNLDPKKVANTRRPPGQGGAGAGTGAGTGRTLGSGTANGATKGNRQGGKQDKPGETE